MSDDSQLHSGQPAELHRYCLRCRRKLRQPKAMQIGYGAVCARKVLQEAEAERGEA